MSLQPCGSSIVKTGCSKWTDSVQKGSRSSFNLPVEDTESVVPMHSVRDEQNTMVKFS